MLLVFLVTLLPGTAMALRPPPSWPVTRAWQQQTPPANILPTTAQHDGVRMAAAGNYFMVAAPSLHTRAAAPRMRLRTELVAAAAVAINPAFLLLDAFGALLKIAWRVALATAFWFALKDTIKEGEESATLAVKIKNQGDGAFKPDLACTCLSSRQLRGTASHLHGHIWLDGRERRVAVRVADRL